MDSYVAMIRLAKEKPAWIPAIRKCVAAHGKKEQKEYPLGFQWSDVGVAASILYTLNTKYELLEVTYKSNSSTCYMVKDIAVVDLALQDINDEKIFTPDKGGGVLRVHLSAATLSRLKEYIAKEYSGDWDAENIVVEMAINEFFDEYIA